MSISVNVHRPNVGSVLVHDESVSVKLRPHNAKDTDTVTGVTLFLDLQQVITLREVLADIEEHWDDLEPGDSIRDTDIPGYIRRKNESEEDDDA